MGSSITQESKNNVSLSLEAKDDSMTWDSSDPLTWEDSTGKWDAPSRPLIKEDKNNVSLTLEDKL